MKPKKRCGQIKPDGNRCRTDALPGKEVCLFHDEESADKCAEGRKRGGIVRSAKAATLPPDTPDLPLKSVADVVEALRQTINQVRRGQIDPKIGNCVGVLASVILKAIEGSELEARLAALEDQAHKPGIRLCN